MNILVTGGAGRLGIQLAVRLHQDGHRVKVMDLPACDFDVFESLDHIKVVKGDIREVDTVEKAAAGVEAIYHLAALLPPVSEQDRQTTFDINVGGTEKLVEAAARASGQVHLVYASSVSTYGDTSDEDPPVSVDHPQNPMDTYAESKIRAEAVVRSSELPHTILRISGIAVPAFLDPPDEWPFMADQRMEFIALNNLVTGMVNVLGTEQARGKVFNVAGGQSWQVTGEEYVRRFCQTMDIPIEDQQYSAKPGWLDWYDTSDSQLILQYQDTSFEEFHKLLKAAVEEALS